MCKLICKDRTRPCIYKLIIPVTSCIPFKLIIHTWVYRKAGGCCSQNIHHELLSVKIPRPMKSIFVPVPHVKHIFFLVCIPLPVYPLVYLFEVLLSLTFKVLCGTKRSHEEDGGIYDRNFAVPSSSGSLHIQKVYEEPFFLLSLAVESLKSTNNSFVALFSGYPTSIYTHDNCRKPKSHTGYACRIMNRIIFYKTIRVFHK